MQNGEEAYGSRHRFKFNIKAQFDIPKYRMLFPCSKHHCLTINDKYHCNVSLDLDSCSCLRNSVL